MNTKAFHILPKFLHTNSWILGKVLNVSPNNFHVILKTVLLQSYHKAQSEEEF